MSERRIRVLIVDDSETMRAAISQLLLLDPGFEIAGQARDGREAVDLARRLSPDVITMDLQMPNMDGFEAIGAIMSQAPSRILVVCSTQPVNEQVLNVTFRAMEAGALELIAKPDALRPEELRAWGERLRTWVRLMADIPVVRRRRISGVFARSRRNPRGRIDAIGIVASTGGPPPLPTILQAMPKDLPVPILIAQHMAPGFSDGLARWFRQLTPLSVKLAEEGQPAMPGTAYLPPDDRDLEVDDEGVIRLPKSAGGHWPSGNRLLASLARAYVERAAGVVLTGMGEDGAQGLLAIRRANGTTMVQDEASSIVFGMPQAALKIQAASWVLPVGSIGPTLRELSTRP